MYNIGRGSYCAGAGLRDIKEYEGAEGIRGCRDLLSV
jgi:hypothetical protein